MVIEEVFAVLFLLLVIGLAIWGGIRTFQRNWVLAILLLLFISPIWVIWAFVELFLPDPVKKPTQINIQPIEVTLKKD